MWGISNFEKIKKLGFFSIANPELSYFQYKFPQCFTSKLRKKKGQGNKTRGPKGHCRSPENNERIKN